MFDKPNAMQTLGLELEGSTLKGVQLSVNKGQPILDQIFEIEIDLQQAITDHVNPLYMSDDGQVLREKIQQSLLVTTLRSDEVLVRPLDLKLKKERDIDAVLAFQAEPLLPYPVENALLDKITLAQNKEGTQLTLVAARKDHVQQHIALWDPLQIEPEVIGCEPAALAAFCKLFLTDENAQLVVHLGKTHTTCVLVKEGQLLAAQAAHTGLNDLIQAFAQERELRPKTLPEQLNAVDFASIDREKTPILYNMLDSWRLEITRVLYALTKQYKGHGMPSILLTGEGAILPTLGTSLCQRFNSSFIEPISNPAFSLSNDQLRSYAIPLGAALSGLPSAKDQVNFRQQEYVYPNPWKRFKKPLALYFALCCAFAVAFYIFGETYLGYQEDQVREEYVALLGTMNKSYPVFEKEYMAKYPSGNDADEELRSINLMTQEEISHRLQHLHKELKNTPDSFPLQPNTPRVSEVLAWLSTHPSATTKDRETGVQTSLQIDSFSYTVVKRPEPKKPQEKYQVKVEIEFSAPTPKMAREFHDALIAPNDMVDPKGEVKWSTNRGKYRTSFFLKDKTAYPSSTKMEG